MTLIEVMAALALSGVVLGGAHALFTALGSTGARTSQRALSVDEFGEGERHLRMTLAMLRGPSTGGDPFFGDLEGMRFTSSCLAAGGWQQRCRVMLQLVRQRDSTFVQLSEDDVGGTVVARHPGAWHLVFLEREWERDLWLAAWRAPATVPVAIAMVSARDTLVYLGGGR